MFRRPIESTQYRTFAFGQRCKLLGVRPSMGSRGDAYDNAIAASFSATLEVECLAKYRFTTHTKARLAIFRYIGGWYNPHRRHSALGPCSLLAYEQAYVVQSRAA